jgi:hypothetical protein
MILSHKHKLCFIHIPRTGGSWLTYKILHYEDDHNGIGKEMHTSKGDQIKIGRHTKLNDIYAKEKQLDISLESYFKFTVSRHPCSRFMSTWRYFSQYMKTAERNNLNCAEDLMTWIENGTTKQHCLPQAHWHDKRFDDIVKFEDIESFDLKEYIPKWSLKKRPIRKSSYKKQISKNLQSRIENFYKMDYELFGY